MWRGDISGKAAGAPSSIPPNKFGCRDLGCHLSLPVFCKLALTVESDSEESNSEGPEEIEGSEGEDSEECRLVDEL